MNKKELLKLPCAAPDWMQKKAKDSTKTTFLLRRKFGPIATYEIYLTKELKEGDIKPEFIVFKDRHDWINYYPKDNWWAKARFENATIPVKENGRIHYSTYYLAQYDILTNLRRWQQKIGEKRLKERIRKERKRVKEIMSLVPELPEDFTDFVENDLMKNSNYIIYNRKEDTAYCTRCNKKYTVTELEIQNNTKAEHMKEYQRCIECGTWLKQISYGMSRRDKGFKRGTEIMQRYGSGVIVREFNVYRDFESNQTRNGKADKMKTTISEIHRYIITPEKYQQYETEIIQVTSGKYKKIWSDKTNKNFNLYGPRDGKYYTKDVAEIIQGTALACEGVTELIKEYVDKRPYENGLEDGVKQAQKRPYLEQFVKAGLKQLAASDLKGDCYRITINKEETKLVRMLGINKEELRILRDSKDQKKAAEIIQAFHQAERATSKEIIESACRIADRRMARYKLEELLRKDVNVLKALKYIEAREIRMSDFVDHLNLMEKLGIPKKKSNMYPTDFEKSHQDEIEEDILRNDETVSTEINKKFKSTYNSWKKLIAKYKVTTEAKGYKIVLPDSPTDIKVEGRCLHHCVGSYVDRAAEGKTLIFYVRQTEKVRLYTAEYRHGELIQIRASCNDPAVADAKRLAQRFAKGLAAAEEKEAKKKHTKRAEQTAIAV